jgi:ATP-binding cassette subfamily C (CFTR/MRP) protein 4
MIDVIQNAIHIVAAFTLVVSVNPWLIIPTAIVALFFYFFSLFFIRTSRSIKRLEGISKLTPLNIEYLMCHAGTTLMSIFINLSITARSPVFGHVSDSLQGLATIRALNAKEILVDEFDDHQNLHSSACFIFFSGSRGLGMYLDLFCALFLTCVLFTLMLLDNTTLAGDIGLAITQCILLINTLQWGVRQFAELENEMTSVERVIEYFKLPKEFCDSDSVVARKQSNEFSDISGSTLHLTNDLDNRILRIWPTDGQIEFRNVHLRYDKQGPAILKNLNFVIHPREKIGIVGRTGAGKSSLINSLFRLAYIEGEIYIDQVLTNTLGLHDLRSQVNNLYSLIYIHTYIHTYIYIYIYFFYFSSFFLFGCAYACIQIYTNKLNAVRNEYLEKIFNRNACAM